MGSDSGSNRPCFADVQMHRREFALSARFAETDAAVKRRIAAFAERGAMSAVFFVRVSQTFAPIAVQAARAVRFFAERSGKRSRSAQNQIRKCRDVRAPCA